MRIILHFTRFLLLALLALSSFVPLTLAQEVSIPDPGLNAAVRETLQIPTGPLTEPDLLRLINLDASSRDVSSVEGLEAARNLERLFLDSNGLTNFSLPGTLTNLIELYLSSNPLTNCSLPGGLPHLTTLDIQFCSLTELTLPAGLTRLTELDLGVNGLTGFAVPADATNLAILSLFFNQLTNLTLPPGLTRLSSIDLDENRLTHFTLPLDLPGLDSLFLRDNQLSDFILPAGLSRLSFLALDGNQLTRFTFSAGLTNLSSVGLTGNQLTSLTLPADMQQLDSLFVDGNPLTTLVLSEELAATKLAAEVVALRAQGVSVFTFCPAVEVSVPDPELNNAIRQTLQKAVGPLTEQDMLSLTALNACCRNVTNLQGLEAARALTSLSLDHNLFTDFSIAGGMTNLIRLDLSFNSLTNVSIPSGLTKLATLLIQGNLLTHLNLPDGLTALNKLDLDDNRLTSFTLPAGLTNLSSVGLTGNQLTSLTLPPDLLQLHALFVDRNPFTTLVLSEPLAATNLAGTVAFLRNQGISVFTYPLAVSMVSPRRTLAGAFEFALTGPPGVYAVLGSTDLAVWSALDVVTNRLGNISFVDVTANLSPQKFYRALLQSPPTNLVFHPGQYFYDGQLDQRAGPQQQ